MNRVLMKSMRPSAGLKIRARVPIVLSPARLQRSSHRSRPLFIVKSSGAEEEEDFEYEEGSFITDDDDEYEYDDDDDPSMRYYLDSADVKAYEKWAETGLFYGITLNPTILKRDGVQCNLQSLRNLTRHAFDLEAEELHLQTWGATWNDMYATGLDLYELDSRIVVKVPMTADGIKAANRLLLDSVPVTLTGVYSAHQVATAMALGVDFIAPYLGRMNDAGKNGVEEISRMQDIIDMSSYNQGETRLLVASIRSADEIGMLAAIGCNTFAISPQVAEQLLNDPMTIEAAEIFQEHANEMGAMRDQ